MTQSGWKRVVCEQSRPLATETQEGKSGRCCSYGLAFMAVVREVGWAEGNIWNGEASRLLTAADRLRLGSRRREWGQKTEQKNTLY